MSILDTSDDPLPSSNFFTQTSVPKVSLVPGGFVSCLSSSLYEIRHRSQAIGKYPSILFLIDSFFESLGSLSQIEVLSGDLVLFIDTQREPSTIFVDDLMRRAGELFDNKVPACVVGIGGGSVLDCAKAVSNLYGNPGPAASYQGWDLLQIRGVPKIGIPTISGTGAESSRTCVLTNHETGIKLGMNSQFSVFDEVILDPELTLTVPREQHFFTAMDTFAHCFESQRGRYRNPIADSYSRAALSLLREVFTSGDIFSESNRTKLMVSSFLGGASLAGSYVGLVHPISSALSVVFGTHHGVANCMTMRAMADYYPIEYAEFWKYAERLGIEIPLPSNSELTPNDLDRLVSSTLMHEKPLSNALGVNYRSVIHKSELSRIFMKIVNG